MTLSADVRSRVRPASRLVMVAASSVLLHTACGKAGGEGGGEQPPAKHFPAPEGGTATRDRADQVRLEWTLPAGAAPTAIAIERDGAELLRLPSDATAYEDRAAEPGTIDPPTLDVEADMDAVRLSWTEPRRAPGREHLYRIVALYDADGRGVSEAVTGQRAAEAVSGYRVSRDGAELASLPVTASSFEDRDAEAGTVVPSALGPALPDEVAISLAWTAPALVPGATHRYVVEAISPLGSSASPPVDASRSPPRLLSWILLRDDEVLVSLDPWETSYVDDRAAPGFIEAPSLEPEETRDAVRLDWNHPVARPGPSHRYTLAALTTAGTIHSPGEVTAARRAPALVGYRLLRDGELLAHVDAAAARFTDAQAMPGTVEDPELATASREDAVALSWTRPESHAGPTYEYELLAQWAAGESRSEPVTAGRIAPAPLGWELRRDGLAIAELPPSAVSFDDEEAAPGAVEAPRLAATERPDAVELSWSTPGRVPGRAHDYELTLLTAGAESLTSAAVGHRAAPAILGYRLFRAGVEIAAPSDTAASHLDTGAEPGELDPPSLTVSDGVDAVSLSWSQPATRPGPKFVYALEARTGIGPGDRAVSTAGRSAPEITGFSIERDRYPLASLPSTTFEFGDDTATGGAIAAPQAFSASQGTNTNAVELRWQAAASEPGPVHSYRVIADAIGAPPAVSAEVTGGRQARAIDGYEFQRDGGPWIDAGSGIAHDDADAPMGTIQAAATAIADRFRGFVEASLAGTPTITPPAPSSYRIRAVSGAFASPPSTLATGVRKIGSKVDVQWQRSAADSDGGYSDLPGAGSATWLDFDAAPDEGRYYRARLHAPGAEGSSSASRAITRTFSSIGAGFGHSCGVRMDGRVVCWGSNDDGQTQAPGDSFISVAPGGYHTCGVRTDGKVVCWGRNTHGQAPMQASADSFTSVSGGLLHTCGVRVDGKVVCWGDTSMGQTPAPASADSFTAVSAGGLHTCALRIDGKVVCWGNNSDGQAPPQPTADSFSSVSAGLFHTCGVRADGKLICWGNVASGQGPAQATVDSFTSVSAGETNTCGLRTDGKVVCWGIYVQAASLAAADPFTSVSAGGSHACGVRADGKVECWGVNDVGQAPPSVPADSFTSLSAGANHTCGVRVDGRVVCWGYNVAGQAPRQVTADTFTSISAGESHTCGVRADGKVVCWGSNALGQAPAQATTDSFTRVSAGANHTCGLRTDGRGICWGDDPTGQAPVQTSPFAFTDLSAGGSASCGVQIDNKVTCWTSRHVGQAPWEGTTTSFSTVSVGEGHVCGMRLDGRVQCWGDNSYGEAPQQASADLFTGVSAGGNHSCGVRAADGKVVCWGHNSYGQAPTQATAESFTSVSAGRNHTCGLRVDGKAICWGLDTVGQAPRYRAAP